MGQKCPVNNRKNIMKFIKELSQVIKDMDDLDKKPLEAFSKSSRIIMLIIIWSIVCSFALVDNLFLNLFYWLFCAFGVIGLYGEIRSSNTPYKIKIFAHTRLVMPESIKYYSDGPMAKLFNICNFVGMGRMMMPILLAISGYIPASLLCLFLLIIAAYTHGESVRNYLNDNTITPIIEMTTRESIESQMGLYESIIKENELDELEIKLYNKLIEDLEFKLGGYDEIS